ncbi:gfo/Idh/MocA family oxidoreductase [Paenibacillus sp. LMG 31461]|uniref:Gfo/Idh/MocA family oxidoreductase n=1 Tax=Paenibacillus plantarum TaxID=2654975 RepID=A0ABX1X933_9BACL|nr:Gfo/Idh/MocA family oxidoreductase [Paenibacillus plantarum]NOU64904.1 gfo/Idh/MocA family oxidoreductase [Paenibacillus plantarum]
MEKAELKVAVLGAGAIAGQHFDAIRRTDGFVACAVADIQLERAQAIAETYGITDYRDYQELIRQERPDVVVIALPHFLHRETAIFAAEHGCHLMLEKPMALNVAECDDIMEAANKADIRILIGHTQHYIAENIHAKRIIESGELGEIVMINDVRHLNYFQDTRPQWFLEKDKSGGGILANLGTHSIDKIQWLMDSSVRKVSAAVSHHGKRGNVEGSGIIYMELASGLPASIAQSGYPGATRNETEIIGTLGMLKLVTGVSLWISRGGAYEQVDVPPMDTPFELQYKDLLSAIEAKSETSCPPEYARGVIAALEAVYRAAETGVEQFL